MSAKAGLLRLPWYRQGSRKNTIKKAYRKLAKRYHRYEQRQSTGRREIQGSNRSLQCPQRSGKEENV